MTEWAAPHVTEAVAKHELTLYGNGAGKEGITTRVTVLEGKVSGIEAEVRSLIKWSHYIMGAVGVATVAAQFIVPEIIGR